MDWLVVGAFIVVGLLLILAEVILVPGATVVGLLGLGVLSYGIFYAYDEIGTQSGHLTLGSASVLTIVMLVVAFRNRSYERFSLKNTLFSKVNDGFFLPKKGEKGRTVSTLKPVGKALFGDELVEVRSNGVYIGENVQIEVRSVQGTKIIVQPITEIK